MNVKTVEAFVLMLLFFLSGFAGLIYQSAWSQQLTLIFGSTELSIAAVLASYMAGLALGAKLASIYLNIVKKPAVAYAVLELFIALSALFVPVLMLFVEHIYSFFYGTEDLSSISSNYAFMFLIGSFFVLLIPTTLMGATLPLLSKYIVRSNNNIGQKIGMLYSINTYGACFGALISAFVFLPNIGLSNTIYIAVGINAIIFIVGLIFFKNKAQSEADSNSNDKLEIKNKWMLGIMLISGSVSLAYEILWTRLLSQVLGGSVYSFGIMLFVFLLGIALGASVGSWLCKKRHPLVYFVIVQIGIALCFYTSFYWADHLTQIEMSREFGSISFIFEGLKIGLLTLLPGALFIGATFPLAIHICAGNYKKSGIVTAKVYSWNTVGAILGAALMGFYLLPQFGFALANKILFSISMILAIVILMIKLKFIKTTLLVILLFSTIHLTPLKEPMQLLKYSVLNNTVQKSEVAFFGIGQSATVMLLDNGSKMRLLTNGLPESSIQMEGSRVGEFFLARWLSMLPVLANPDAKNMLIVGLGAGLTLKAVPKSIENIDVVELEKEVIKANQAMSDYRGIDPLNDPRLKLHHNDARNALKTSTKKFDIIVSQPSHPWTAGSSNLYTKEFFSLIKSRLNPKGKFVQWIGMSYIDTKLLKTLLATLNSEFNYVQLYQPLSKGGLVFLASKEPINITENDFNHSSNVASWRKMGVSSWEDFQPSLRLDSKETQSISKYNYPSTDYHNILKIRSPKILKKPLTKVRLNDFISQYDPLHIIRTENKKMTAIRRLLREKNLKRAESIASHLTNPHHKKIAYAIINDEVILNNKSKQRLINLMDRDWNQNLLYRLLGRELKILSQQKLPYYIVESIKNDKTAYMLVNAWRMNRQNKWQEVKKIDIKLASIKVSNPAYSLAKRIRIEWMSQSDDLDDHKYGMMLIESELVINNNINLLFLYFKSCLFLDLHHQCIVTLYEFSKFKALLANNNFKEIIEKMYLDLAQSINKEEIDKNTLLNKLNKAIKHIGI